MLLVIVLYAALASTFILAKNALAYASPCFLIGFRMILAGSILLTYQGLRDRSRLVFKRADAWLFFKTALFHIYLSFVLEFWALRHLSALKTTVIYTATPFIAAILSYVLIKERLSWQKVVGIVIGLGGLLPVILASTAKSEVAMAWGGVTLPEIVLFGAVVSGAYAWFLVKELMQRGYALTLINGIAMLIGGVMSMLTALLVEDMHHAVTAWVPFLGVLALLLPISLIVYNLYGYLLRSYSITFLSFAGFLSPSFGMMYAWLLGGQVLTWHYPVSLCLVTTGLYIFYRQELKKQGIAS